MTGDAMPELRDYADEQRAAEVRGMKLGSAVLDVGRFDRSDYADELSTAEANDRIGTKILFENDRVRVWEIDLKPGGRMPFHSHTTPYFWVCVDGAPATGREPDGSMSLFDHQAGEVDFLPLRPGEQLVHDLENSGASRLRFVTVELLNYFPRINGRV